MDVEDEGTADERRSDVPNCSDDNSPYMTTREARPARCGIIEAGPHTASIGEYLSRGDENGKCEGVLKTQNPVESPPESSRPDRPDHDFPRQPILPPLPT